MESLLTKKRSSPMLQLSSKNQNQYRMAFHVACPITCRRICYCSLGFPRNLASDKTRHHFIQDASRVADFFKDPLPIVSDHKRTVQVLVPKIVLPPPPPSSVAAIGDGDGFVDGDEMVSAQNKRAALQKKAAAASLVAEDFARRFESGSMDDSGDLQVEDGQSNTKVMCRLCFSGENEGSERAWKMLSCKSCSKKYHRNCVKAWAHDRDLFHWSSWTCPSCRTCEVCRRTGDPSKFMFCRRCDGAYHCYCQQPPHKNVNHGPYLCPKHTRCHSCASVVPGNGLSTRWFLGYTCCDACGRLFTKGNYCPVCLKVYRDSESTPMVCCDLCQRWVHCQCDDISDEKYLQYQVDDNLQYKCATCRGECHQVRDVDDAIRELWKRRDKDDQELIASLREASGLPTRDDLFSITPFSDDEESGPTMSRPLKFSIKGLTDNSPKKTKESGKKSSKKKNAKKKGHRSSIIRRIEENEYFEGDSVAPPCIHEGNNDELQSPKSAEPFSSPTAGSFNGGICSTNQMGAGKRKIMDVIGVSNGNKKIKMVHIDNRKSDDFGKDANKSNIINTKGPKLVIHLGGRNKGIASSLRPDASSQREKDFATLNGNELVGQEEMITHNKLDEAAKLGERNGDKVEVPDLPSSQPRGSLIKIKKINSEVPQTKIRFSGGNKADKDEYIPPPGNPQVSHRKSNIRNADLDQTATEAPVMSGPIVYSRKNTEGRSGALGGINNDSILRTSSELQPPPQKEPKPLLKLKFKNPYLENQSSWSSHGEDEKSSVKGQRSKRKRPLIMEKPVEMGDEQDSQTHGDSSMNEIMDANWILQKLGKDAIGKRVEIHQPSDNSWHKGVVSDFVEGTSLVCVGLDNGQTKKLELGKQGIRFISQKAKKR
ncbi:uncharacterized protein LOC124925807 [Impatiens glandulifera]|uniref:uncharacterized protein LOC124925807 n=1 Tax=Impatiens glandulifera TaxID=253017 RepID=UPI001FB15B0C|nr:uncharacterized protein LOC124925807 [Impatiens glandulifera]